MRSGFCGKVVEFCFWIFGFLFRGLGGRDLVGGFVSSFGSGFGSGFGSSLGLRINRVSARFIKGFFWC